MDVKVDDGIQTVDTPSVSSKNPEELYNDWKRFERQLWVMPEEKVVPEEVEIAIGRANELRRSIYTLFGAVPEGGSMKHILLPKIVNDEVNPGNREEQNFLLSYGKDTDDVDTLILGVCGPDTYDSEAGTMDLYTGTSYMYYKLQFDWPTEDHSGKADSVSMGLFQKRKLSSWEHAAFKQNVFGDESKQFRIDLLNRDGQTTSLQMDDINLYPLDRSGKHMMDVWFHQMKRIVDQMQDASIVLPNTRTIKEIVNPRVLYN